MSYYLFLDDERMPKDVTWVKLPDVTWVIVRSHDEFILTIVKNGNPKFIAFDHDLGISYYAGKQDEKTGLSCAKWYGEYVLANHLELADFTVHSMNPIGKKSILNTMYDYFVASQEL